ncbi:MAG: hypothetical protein HUJ31_14440 [Pseudomonadales bacterium]|nr:hypothetical protein [Pseudomonadales bacterium]
MNLTKQLKLLAGVLLLLVGNAAWAAMTGSAHDFTDDQAGTDSWAGGDWCSVCHTPHNPSGTDAPLWDHNSADTTGWTAYGTTSQGTVVGLPTGISKACMGCHDGVTNLDAYGGAVGTTTLGTAYTGTTAVVGTDMSQNHPVSVANHASYSSPTNAVLYSGNVECASCHDVHNGAGIAMLLRTSNASGALCQECHNK